MRICCSKNSFSRFLQYELKEALPTLSSLATLFTLGGHAIYQMHNNRQHWFTYASIASVPIGGLYGSPVVEDVANMMLNYIISKLRD